MSENMGLISLQSLAFQADDAGSIPAARSNYPSLKFAFFYKQALTGMVLRVMSVRPARRRRARSSGPRARPAQGAVAEGGAATAAFYDKPRAGHPH